MSSNFVAASNDTNVYNGNAISITSKDRYLISRVEGELADFDSSVVDAGGEEELPFVEPNIADWESHMLSFGNTHGDYLVANHASSDDAVLQSTYYDATWVYYKIADYTGDTGWLDVADAANEIYGRYITANAGGIPGFWKFPFGLGEKYTRDSNIADKTLIDLIANNGYSASSTDLSYLRGTDRSRETAYAIDTLIVQEQMGGGAHRSYLETLVTLAINHIYTWYNDEAEICPPFMVALTCHSLIAYEDYFPAEFVTDIVQKAADMIWDRQAVTVTGDYTFQYANVINEEYHMDPAFDLNLLIVPIYGYLYRENGNETNLRRGNLLFNAGVERGYLGGSKQFNQAYKLSFDYLEWTNQI